MTTNAGIKTFINAFLLSIVKAVLYDMKCNIISIISDSVFGHDFQ